jgi:hypothetical protein
MLVGYINLKWKNVYSSMSPFTLIANCIYEISIIAI